MTLLEKFADPTIINTLSFNEKLLASTYVAILGMGITFLALTILWFTINMLTKVVVGSNKKKSNVEVVKEVPIVNTTTVVETNDIEIVAVITAAIATVTNQPMNKIFVKNIRRVNDNTPTWQKVGIASQVSNRM